MEKISGCMHLGIRYLLLLHITVTSCSSQATDAIYKYTDKQGQVYFTDKPPAETKTVETIRRDPKNIHRRVDKDGIVLFENFTREYGASGVSKKDLLNKNTQPVEENNNKGRLPENQISSTSHVRNTETSSITAAVIKSISNSLGSLTPLFGMLLIVLGLPLVLKAVNSRFKGRVGENAIAKILDDHGYESLNDVILKDQSEELTQIDHLVKINSGLLIIETKNYSGMIFGKEKEQSWTQRIGRRSYRFQNPLRQNYRHVETVRHYVPAVPVHSRVVFVGDAEFPNGRPTNVLSVEELVLDLDTIQLTKIDSNKLDSAWQEICTHTMIDKNVRKQHLRQLQDKHGYDPLPAIGVSLIAVGALVVIFI